MAKQQQPPGYTRWGLIVFLISLALPFFYFGFAFLMWAASGR